MVYVVEQQAAVGLITRIYKWYDPWSFLAVDLVWKCTKSVE